jgi:predicted lipoprotein with Yx(FWY)xxD motif
MDDAGTCAGIRSLLGVYLTGAIAPADRAAVLRHLAACADCRAELAGLAALPALLRRPPVQAAVQAPAADDEVPGDTGAAGSGEGPRRLARLGTRRRRRHRRRWLLAAAALVLAVAAAAGWALHLTGPPESGPGTSATVLQSRTIGGVTVLTDAGGYTLYWFGPDRAGWSACQGGCAQNWPPVAGPATWGTGVPGEIGAIARPDGSLQATYDGHPLYTTTADTRPGQTKGDSVWSDGGEWHEVVITVPDQGD